MILLLKLFALIFGTVLLLLILKDYFIKNNSNIIFYPSIVFYFFYYVPLFLDLTIGRPIYKSINYGFLISGNDFKSEIFYLIIIIYILLVFRTFQKKYIFNRVFDQKHIYSNLIYFIIMIGMFLYLIPIILNENIFKLILNYDIWYFRDEISNRIKFYSTFFIVAILFILINENRRLQFYLKLTSLIPFITVSFLMNGKRNIVFIFFVGLIYILLSNKIIKSKLTYFILIPSILLMLFSFSLWYTDHFGKTTGTSFEEQYTDYRINFGRDDTLKMTIYSEFDENNFQILEHRGQSLLFYLAFFIPREIWPDKPYPFAVYFTNSMLGNTEVSILGWGMTTSIFDELIANLGLIGLVISPFFLILFCKIAMKYTEGIIGGAILALSILLSMLAIAVQLTAYISAYLFLLFLIIIYLFKKYIRI